MNEDPIDVLIAIMNDGSQPAETRLEAATVLMPYFHAPLSHIDQEEDDDE